MNSSLLLSKELITNTVSLIHHQSTLMIMSSERDFPFNLSSNWKLNYIHYPQSYRATLVQISSNMHKLFSNNYSIMYRIQFAVKRISNQMKTIFRLILVASPTMIKRMLPISLKNIRRILNDNENLIREIIDQIDYLFNFLYEVKQLPRDLSCKYYQYPSNKTDLILYNQFDSKNVLEAMCLILQQMKKQFEEIVQLTTKFDLSFTNDMNCLISTLYTIENNAYFLYQLSSTYTDLLDQYVLDQTASMGRYVALSTDEKRSTTLINLSQKFAKILDAVETNFLKQEDEFEINNRMLREAYEKLFDELQDHFEIK
jgi:hypothetical protein